CGIECAEAWAVQRTNLQGDPGKVVTSSVDGVFGASCFGDVDTWITHRRAPAAASPSRLSASAGRNSRSTPPSSAGAFRAHRRADRLARLCHRLRAPRLLRKLRAENS